MIWSNQLWVKLCLCSKSMTFRTSTVWAVKRKGAWLDLREADPAVGTCELFTVRMTFSIDNVDDQNAVTTFQR